jgi:hypothetical protein
MNAISTKDYFLRLLNEGDDNKLIENIERIETALCMTMGLWVELNYAYKGAEIAERCVQLLGDISMKCGHWKRHQKIAYIRNRMLGLQRDYLKQQMEYANA